MFQKITLIALIIAFASCQKKESVEKDKIKLADWLIGNWENTTPEGVLSENWQKHEEQVDGFAARVIQHGPWLLVQ